MTKIMNAFEKRLRRQILAKEREYFLITPPQSEEFALNELKALNLPIHEVQKEKGGILFKGKPDVCYLSNLSLRLASRILMRLTSFKATNFRQMNKILSEFPFELYLFMDASIEMNISSNHSRLYHQDAIREHLKKIISDRLSEHGVAAGYPHTQTIFFRIVDDYCTLSIDSSGELLHKRGIKPHAGKAPIRETLAALVLTHLETHRGSTPLIDPMSGSGTFSIEAAMMAKKIPPGWFRKFAFMQWPSFKENHWRFLIKEHEAKIETLKSPLIFSSDKDKESCQEFQTTINDYRLSDAIHIQNIDFFDLHPKNILKGKGSFIINPPYGYRLGTQEESTELYQNIAKKLKSDFKGWKVAIIAPKNYDALQTLSKIKTKRLFHGGLNVYLILGIA